MNDSFEKELDKTINEGKKDVEEGQKIVGDGGTKRNIDEANVITFSEEQEVIGILRQCPEDVIRQISNLPFNQRPAALNSFLNSLLGGLPLLQKQTVLAQPTNSEKFAKLKQFLGAASDKLKKARK